MPGKALAVRNLSSNETVILVDEWDSPIGQAEKHEAHRAGKLHRAFSILVFNSKGETLIQKRAREKYHSGGLWTNTCDGHPRPGEGILEAGKRRLRDELGFECELREVAKFIYKEPVDNNMTEHEFLHVLVGKYDGEIRPNPLEISEIKWVGFPELKEKVRKEPENYAVWFRLALDRLPTNL